APIILPGKKFPTRNSIRSMELRIKDGEAWLPSSFFVFGSHAFQDCELRQPNFLVPLVHIPRWEWGWFSWDLEVGGQSSVSLPLALIEDWAVAPFGEPTI